YSTPTHSPRRRSLLRRPPMESNMLNIHRLLTSAGFNAVIGDATTVYSRGSETIVVYYPDRPRRQPEWRLYLQDNRASEARGAAALAALIAHAGREAA